MKEILAGISNKEPLILIMELPGVMSKIDEETTSNGVGSANEPPPDSL